MSYSLDPKRETPWMVIDMTTEEGSEWNIDRITSYPNVNGGFPVIELSNENGDWLRLPKNLVDLEDLTDV